MRFISRHILSTVVSSMAFIVALSVGMQTAAAVPEAWPLRVQSVVGMPGTVVEAEFLAAASASGAQCRNYLFPVRESPISDVVRNIFGQLCTAEPGLLGQQPVQVLVHGGATNHVYYDWPYSPDKYNYVRHMTNIGYTTLNIDRLGYGYSDRPPASNLNFDLAAYDLHQIVQYLRGGGLGRTFKTVVSNGYSMGGLTAQVEAAQYKDVDAVMIHAVGHNMLTPRSTALLGTSSYPAYLDPKFSGTEWARDPAYLTTLPGKRAGFYGPPGTWDPEQLAVEESNKDTVAASELVDITTRTYSFQTKEIEAPVLWTPGQFDAIWCGTTGDCSTDPMTANESSYYQPGAFTGRVIPNTGHAVILGYGSYDYFKAVSEWLDQHGISGLR